MLRIADKIFIYNYSLGELGQMYIVNSNVVRQNKL